MGHACLGYENNCTVYFDAKNASLVSFGNVTRGHFRPDADVAGIGTVLALVLPTGIGLLVSLIIGFALILDRVPGVYRFLQRRPTLRNWVPSPNQIPRLSADPASDTHPLLSTTPPTSPPAPSQHYDPVPLHDLTETPQPSPGLTDHDGIGGQQPISPFHDVEHQHRPPALTSSTVATPVSTPVSEHPSLPHRASTAPVAPLRRTNFSDLGSKKSVKTYRPVPRSTPLMKPPSRTGTLKRSLTTQEQDTREYFSDRNTLSEMRYDMLEAIMTSIPDSQILLALGLALSFAGRNKCTMSDYHMKITIYLSLIACTNFCLAFTLVRNFWRSPIAGIVRLLCFTGVLSFLMTVFIWQRRTGYATEPWPSDSRNNSLILLDAVCLMHKHHITDLMELSQSQKDLVGELHSTSNPFVDPDLRSFLVIGIISVITLAIRWYQWMRFRDNGPPREPPKTKSGWLLGIPPKTWLLMGWWVFSWACCGYVYILATRRIFHLRSWLDNSKWMEPDEFSSNPENDVRGFGQVISLVGTAAIILAAMDAMRPRYKTYESEDPDSR
ncbi:hypothetical protein NM208_g3334 [Fusarium decemcellulare]|uniref:Uncharacterized protein n=2 Tax=Fusarium decemcellulare TaxID=57161 RepID=A0ACC1S1G0_9HYPO|nr:hypothetical protein NM208_g9476 [Fusarium decemcellulare]KAJ3543899.1 hypothetical protein NM208_g3334 [Fusarium decemcellulare]